MQRAGLDKRISKVSQTAVRIGHTLELVDQQKKHHLKGQEIISLFLCFDSGMMIDI